ncbi:hypothetical protein RJT34_12537 [Clitoria ternatea]|uniref:Uncharacterized protein n=1 Tax=Clitoria ternatea TaxID=43366 RepID=A0AAN9JP40_CLITE
MNDGIYFTQENGNGSDSDKNSDQAPEYYQPISAADYNGSSDGDHGDDFQQVANDYIMHGMTQNGISSMDLNESVEQKSSDEEEEGEEEERTREESERAITENENQRNTPLTAENTIRVMEAMHVVSFAVVPPDWANEVP